MAGNEWGTSSKALSPNFVRPWELSCLKSNTLVNLGEIGGSPSNLPVNVPPQLASIILMLCSLPVSLLLSLSAVLKKTWNSLNALLRSLCVVVSSQLRDHHARIIYNAKSLHTAFNVGKNASSGYVDEKGLFDTAWLLKRVYCHAALQPSGDPTSQIGWR